MSGCIPPGSWSGGRIVGCIVATVRRPRDSQNVCRWSPRAGGVGKICRMLSRFRSVQKVYPDGSGEGGRFPFYPDGGGDSGRFPAWVRELDGKSGVYVIKNRVFNAIMYVGESHSGKLYGTLTRHFQRWRGQGSGHNYPLFNSVVAVEIVSPSKALRLQEELILKLRPLDNERAVAGS